MGYRISWLAAQLSKQTLLSHLGFVDTGVVDEANESAFSVAELPTGWTILWSNDPSWAKIELCEPLARHSPVVSCWINETAMNSMVNKFDGDDYWFVGHRAEHEEGVEGDMPPEYQDIVDRLTADQSASDAREPGLVDYLFDVPVEIAQRITGFRHDLTEFDWGTPSFTAVEAIARAGVPVPKAGIIGRWFRGESR